MRFINNGTVTDDAWAWENLRREGVTEIGSYRYADPDGVVHRAVWQGGGWRACCGVHVVEKLQEGDAGAITCVLCLGAGA